MRLGYSLHRNGCYVVEACARFFMGPASRSAEVPNTHLSPRVGRWRTERLADRAEQFLGDVEVGAGDLSVFSERADDDEVAGDVVTAEEVAA